MGTFSYVVCSFRYKESITKSTRGWKERFFSRSASPQDLGSDVRRDAGPGVIDHPETRESNRTEVASISNSQEDSLFCGENDHPPAENSSNRSLTEGNVQTPCPTSSGPN